MVCELCKTTINASYMAYNGYRLVYQNYVIGLQWFFTIEIIDVYHIYIYIQNYIPNNYRKKKYINILQ